MPRLYPRFVHDTVKSSAEEKLIRMLQDEPHTDDWVILHSYAIPAPPRSENPSTKIRLRSEVDFLIVCPLGVFVIEVKGGRVAREDQHWVSKDRFGATHKLRESPWEQAYQGVVTIRDEVRSVLGQIMSRPPSVVGYGVILPDSQSTSELKQEEQCTLFGPDLQKGFLQGYVKQLQAFRNSRFTEAGRQPPLLDAQAIGLLRKHFVSNFELPPSRALSYRGAKAALGKFTNTQLDFLLDSNPARDRLLIEGVAGSGKTLLAMKMAREAAANGDRVLFCCFNKLLSGALREAFSDCSLIEVIRSDQLYWRLAAQVGDQQAQRLQEIESADERWLFFTELLEHPEAHQQPVFDYAVFDEAQDYLEPAFQELMSVILRGGVQAGRWSFFLDSDGQGGVYRNLDKEVLQNLTSAATRQYALTLNCRNTLEVAAGCAAVCQTHLNARVDGGHFKSLFVTSATEFAEAATYARKLIDGGDFQPGQITILVLNQIHLEKMTEAMQAQDLKVCLVEENNSSAVIKSESITITLSTCSAFKGLENDCILVVGGVDPNGDREWVQAVKYAGCSRARLHLAVCIPKSQKQSVETTYRENEAAMQKDMDAKSLDW